MIDKQKLLTWIEDKKYVFAVDDYDHAADDDSPYEVGMWAGCMKVLNMLDMDIRAGNLDVEEDREERYEDRLHFKMDANGNLTRVEGTG